MRKLPVLSICAPLLLIGAAYPDPTAHDPAAADPVATTAGPVTYRPCRPGAGDDRCIQLYERGVRAAYARWLRERRGGEQLARVAVGGPEPREHRARRHTPSGHGSAGRAPHQAGETRCHEPPAHRPEPRAHDVQSGETRGM
jgi:hypothetical protein